MDLVANMKTEILKVPLGFIRCVQLPFAILAFATASGYSSCLSYQCPSAAATTVPPATAPPGSFGKVCWSYPYNKLVKETLIHCNSTGVTPASPTVPLSHEVLSSPSEFYVTIGVFAFLYILGILFIYLALLPRYEADTRAPVVDLLATAVFAMMWFISACAFANAVVRLKSATDYHKVSKMIGCPATAGDECITHHPSYGTLDVSILVGFANFILWAGNCWFVYKETVFFKPRNDPASTFGQPDPTLGSLP